MKNLLIIFILFVSTVNGQTNDPLHIPKYIYEDCQNNFSLTPIDSSFCNFYIINFKDTVYFTQSSCIVQVQTTSPLTFKRRIQNGYANGFLRIYTQNENSFSWLDGNFSNGIITYGSYLEFYTNSRLKLTGQFEKGQRNGVWTWYFENGQLLRIVIYDNAEMIKEIEYDINGHIIEEYDFVKEKINSNSQ